MKDTVAPEGNVEVTPSRKKLVQARLPFKVLSEPSSPSTPPVCQESRKRKLSSQPTEVQCKIGKICKENESFDSAEPIVIDDDSRECVETKTLETEKPLNPYVKLVEKTLKKKLKKHKKQKSLKKSPTLNENSNDDVILVENKCETTDHIKEISDASVVGVKISENEPLQEQMDTSEVAQCETNHTYFKEKNAVQENSTSFKSEERSLVSTPKSSKSEEQSLVSTPKSSKIKRIKKVTVIDTKASEEVEKISLKNKDDVKIISEDLTLDGEVSISLHAEKELSPKKNDNSTEIVTPKQTKMLSKLMKENEKSPKLDESSTEVCTPKQNVSHINDNGDGSSPKPMQLTPKQLQRKLESAKKREEKEKERLEREKKRQQEKEERTKQRQEKEEQRKKEREEKEDQKRREREEKEELKKKEREEKEKQKELEKKEREEKEEQKRKEREEKEEQRRKEKEAKEEERKKKLDALEEEKRLKELEKQEQELKRKKAAEAFVNFFVPKQKVEREQPEQSQTAMLSSFAIKSDMRLAPLVRHRLNSDEKKSLEECIVDQGTERSKLYVDALRNKEILPKRSTKTWPIDDKDDDDDVMIVENEDDDLPPVDAAGVAITFESDANRLKLRPKLFSFHENRRPPYWGTWRKKSASITPRRPFGTDEKLLDYEIDSDDEWEDEGEGESIAGSACGGSDNEDNDNDEYEVDNEFFVPHGYLSDEEATVDGDDVMSLSPETQKAKLKHLEDEFENEHKKPTEKLKPRIYGPVWATEDNNKPPNCIESLWKYFQKMAMILDEPLLTPPAEAEKPEPKDKEKKQKKKKEGDTEEKVKKRKKEEPRKSDGKQKKHTPDPKKNQMHIMNFLKPKT